MPSSPSPVQHRRISSVTLEPLDYEKRRSTSRGHGKVSGSYHMSISKIVIVFLLSVCTLYSVTNVWKRLRGQANHTNGVYHNTLPKAIPIQPFDLKGEKLFKQLGQHEKAVSRTWEKAISELEDTARSLFRERFEEPPKQLFPLPHGIPGTGISSQEEAEALQRYLDCASSNGEWIYSPDGAHLNGSSLPVHKQSSALASCDKAFYKHSPTAVSDENWNVRPSLKWYWRPSSTCSDLLKPAWMQSSSQRADRPLMTRSSLCRYLRHKNILLIGASPTHYLIHDLLLDWTSKRPLTCYGDLYCKEHAICADEIVEVDPSINQWQEDTRPYDRLPDPPASLSQSGKTPRPASASNGTDTHGTVLRYRRVDSMFLNSSPSHPRHQAAFIHPHTGVRDINMYAVADGRRSDLTILYKAPIPYPRPSRTSSTLNKRVLKLTAFLKEPAHDLESKMSTLIDLVTLVTKELWLPELLESLRALKAPPAPLNSLIIYRGGWRMQDECSRNGFIVDSPANVTIVGDGPLPYMDQLDSEDSFMRPSNDIPTTYYNLQTIIQNHLIRAYVAPRLSIPFIDLETAPGIWKSGLVGGAGSTQVFSSGKKALSPPSSQRSADCLRMCLPSPGLSLETLFLGSLHSIFEWGWGGEARRKVWTGPSFVPVRQRKDSQKIKQ
ncbi:hypothetical protein P389DRAFT_31748 [Cystobasidium minutum MCA 4210]|uniref:uncharacterized protein n=1 Tax=Cystobasidium minutum MCA 4210 TaxID=1397322 RepID=UPI0034CFEE88|eukprot:jgi/Rhomi1/31748/CE31747_369